MALDPRIALAVQPTNISGAIQQGLEDRQAREMMPLQLEAAKKQNELLQAQAANTQQEADKAELLRQATGAKYTMGALEQLKSLPPEQRMPVWQMHAAKLKAMNFNPDNIAPEDVTTDEGLTRSISAVSPFVSAAEEKLRAHTVGGATRTVVDGKLTSNITVYDPRTNEAKNIAVQIPGAGADVLGQTAEQIRQGKIGTAQQLQNIDTAGAIDVARQTIPLAGQKAGEEGKARTRSELEQKDIQTVLDDGREAMGAKRRLVQASELLKKVNTGGFNSALNDVAQFLNMKNTGDAGELAGLFQQRIIQDMAIIKGNPTNYEGMRVEVAGPNFKASNETNLALIESSIKAADRNIEYAQEVYNEEMKDSPNSWKAFRPIFGQKQKDKPPAGGGETPSNANPAVNVKPEMQNRYNDLKSKYQQG